MNKKALDEKYSYQIDEYNMVVHLFRGEVECQEFLTNSLLSAIFKIEALEKENAELKSRECWKSCEYANPKSELIAQHIKDVQQLTKAKELLKDITSSYGSTEVSEAQLYLKIKKAEQFLNSEVKMTEDDF